MMRTNSKARPPVIRAAAAVVLTGLGTASLSNPAEAVTLFFGDDGSAPYGDFELTTGAFAGANYYDNQAKVGGVAPLAADTVQIGNDATVTHASGTVAVTSIRVGPAPGSNPTDGGNVVISYPKNGTLNISGGALQTTDTGLLSLSIGDGNSGTVNVSGNAEVTILGRTAVGVAGPAATLNSAGTLTISDTSRFAASGTAGIVIGGQRMRGHLTVNDSAELLVANGPMMIGSHDLGGSTVEVNGGTITIGASDALQGLTLGGGLGGSNSLSISSGIVISYGSFNIGAGAGDNNSVTMDGGELTVTGAGSWLRVGSSGGAAASTGNTFVQNDGVVNAIGINAAGESLLIAGPAGSGGSYTLNGGTLNVAGTAQIGNRGNASFAIAGGTASFGEVNIANYQGSVSTFQVSGSDGVISVASRFTASAGDDSLTFPDGLRGASTLIFATDAAGLVSTIDVTNADGIAIFGADVTIQLDTSLTGTPQAVYNLITASDIVADLGAITFEGPDGYVLQITSGLRGEILQAVVPEPMSLSLLAAPALLSRRRRRN